MPDMGVVDPLRDLKRRHWWILEFPAEAALANLSLSLKEASLPSISLPRIEIHRKNERYYLPGKPEYGELSFSFYAYLDQDLDGGRLMYEWLQKMYAAGPGGGLTTGDMGFKADYAFDCTMVLTDGIGTEVEEWRYAGCFPTSIDYGSLDYEDAGAIMVSVTLSIDKAVKVSPAVAG